MKNHSSIINIIACICLAVNSASPKSSNLIIRISKSYSIENKSVIS